MVKRPVYAVLTGYFFVFVFWMGLLLRFGVPGRLLKCDKKFEKIGFNMYKIENI